MKEAVKRLCYKMRRWNRDEPNMSDGALLIKVEDLIYLALGSENANVVNFKMIQLILHILARQLRMLERQVEIREFSEFPNIQREPSGKSVVKVTEKEKGREKEKEKVKEKGETRNIESKDRSTEKYDRDTKKDKSGFPGADLTNAKMVSDDTPLERQEAGKKSGKEPTKVAQKHQSSKKEKKKSRKGKGACYKSYYKTQDNASSAMESSITIEEIERDKSKVLVAEKGPVSTGRPRVGSVEVVTRSQFELLEGEVKRLAESVGLSTDLTLPDNEQLKNDLLEGNVTLTEAMQAMQVNARVRAAEHAIGRMAGLLTQLAATGAIPEDLAQELKAAQLELTNVQGDESVEGMRSRASSVQSTGYSVQGPGSHLPGRRLPPSSEGHRDLHTAMVTRPDLDETLRALKADMTRSIQQLTSKSTLAAETAAKTAQSVAERLEVSHQLEGRIDEMLSLVSDYAVQLDGFDAGLATQMHGFQEQMGQIRTDLKCGLEQLAAAGDDTDATAIRELTEHYEGLVSQLEHVDNTHQAILTFQAKLSDELRSLVESVEMLRDQKADREEIQDALRDKADISRLTGLLTEEQFKVAREELEQLFEGCHQKFRKQDKAWTLSKASSDHRTLEMEKMEMLSFHELDKSAMEELMETTGKKVGQVELASEREALQKRLRELHQHLQRLEEQLGEPKAAVLMRHLCLGAVCASCGASAMMRPGEEPIPPALPASLPAHPLHPPHPTSPPTTSIPPAPPTPQPCMMTIAETTAIDDDTETLRRWCGGAHTLQVAGRQRSPRMVTVAAPTRRYDGIGTDGKMYLLEEELQPCVECNVPNVCDGGGDALLQEPPILD